MISSNQYVSVTVSIIQKFSMIFFPKNSGDNAEDDSLDSSVAGKMLPRSLMLISLSLSSASGHLQPHAAVMSREPAITLAPRAAAAPPTCSHEVDPANACTSIAMAGWCLCNNDGTTYAEMTTGSDAPCGYTMLPSPTSWSCASTTITG